MRTAGLVRPRVPSEDLARKPSAADSDCRPTNPPDYKWKTHILGDVADIWNGATPSTQIPAYWNGTIPFVTPTDVTETSGKYLDATARSITAEGLSSCPARLLPAGTILVCSRATIGEIKIAATPLCTNQGFKSLVCRGTVSNEFVYYLLLTLKPKMVERATGSTFLEIDRRQMASIEAKFPLLAEQHAIAEALSDVDGLIQALEALIAKKRTVKHAAMQQLLTGKARLPGFYGKWKARPLGTICTFLPTASNPRSHLNDNGDVEYIHYGDVHAHPQPVLDCTNRSLPRIATQRIGNAAPLRNGDLVIVDASEDLEGVGKSVEVQGITDRPVVAGLHTILCRGDDNAWASGFKAYLQFIPAFRSILARLAAGTSVYAISARQLASVELRLPSRSEQAAIVSVLSDMDAEIAVLEQRLGKTRAVKQGMMQQLLTGRVRLVEPEVAATAP